MPLDPPPSDFIPPMAATAIAQLSTRIQLQSHHACPSSRRSIRIASAPPPLVLVHGDGLAKNYLNLIGKQNNARLHYWFQPKMQNFHNLFGPAVLRPRSKTFEQIRAGFRKAGPGTQDEVAPIVLKS